MAGEITRYEIEGGKDQFDWRAWENTNGEWVLYNDFLPILERLEAAEKALEAAEDALRNHACMTQDAPCLRTPEECRQDCGKQAGLAIIRARAYMEKYHGR